MNVEKKLYIQPTVSIVACGRFCDSEFGDWGSGVEDGAGKATGFEEEDDEDVDSDSFYQKWDVEW